MRINTNIGALNAYNNLENTNANLNASLAQLLLQINWRGGNGLVIG